MNWTKDCAYDDAQKRAFHTTARARLRQLAAALRLPPDSHDLRTNKAGVAVSGEITLHNEAVYIQVSHSALGGGMGILIRTCRGRRDYTGGPNHWAPLALLDDIPALAAKVRAIAPGLCSRDAGERKSAALRFVTGLEVRERSRTGPSRRVPMTKAQPRIALSQSRDIPFDKLMLSQSNVRHVKAGVGIEELAEDIARHTMLQSITVRPLFDESGNETGVYEIPAGGRRFRALELLVKQKRLAKTAPIPRVIRADGIAEEDSL